MKEIGGYLELDTYRLPMLHENGIALNSGRNCLAYLIQKKKIKKIFVPKFLCASVAEVCRREGAEVVYYSINSKFMPTLESSDAWVYIVNYYGQLSNELLHYFKKKYRNIIVDNVQAYFQEAIEGIDTIYTCRKFLGVPDGAFLYSDVGLDDLDIDESFDRVRFLLGRYEKSASEFYCDYIKEENCFSDWKIKKMSLLTRNLLHGIDYEFVKNRRKNNFEYLHSVFKDNNKLEVSVVEGPYMYPLYIENGALIRRKLQERKIYIPTLWPDVFDLCRENEQEYDMSKNILPIPVDQRYDIEDMKYIYNQFKSIVREVGNVCK